MLMKIAKSPDLSEKKCNGVEMNEEKIKMIK